MKSEEKRMKRWPRLGSLKLWHASVKDFTMSPWFSPVVLCVYRGLAAFYLMSWWLYNISANMHNGKMFIYFTNLSFTVTAFYFAIGMNLSCITIMQRREERYGNEDENVERQPLAFLADKCPVDKSKDINMSADDIGTEASEKAAPKEEDELTIPFADPSDAAIASPTIIRGENSPKNTRKFKSSIEEEDEDNASSCSGSSGRLRGGTAANVCHQVYWLLYNISTNISVLTAIGHFAWNNVFDDQSFYANVLTKEVVGMGLIVMETLICGIPVRLCHVVYPMLFTIVYIIFTAIYYASGGTNIEGKSYVYRLLDYDKIDIWSGGILVLTVFAAQPLIQLVFYVVSVIRRCLANRVCRCRR